MLLFRKSDFFIFKVSNSNMPQFFFGAKLFCLLSEWNRVVRTVGYKVNLKLPLFQKYKNSITTSHFLKKEAALDNGMKPFFMEIF